MPSAESSVSPACVGDPSLPKVGTVSRVDVAYNVTVVCVAVLVGVGTLLLAIAYGMSQRDPHESKVRAKVEMTFWTVLGGFLGFVFGTGIAEKFAGLTSIP